MRPVLKTTRSLTAVPRLALARRSQANPAVQAARQQPKVVVVEEQLHVRTTTVVSPGAAAAGAGRVKAPQASDLAQKSDEELVSLIEAGKVRFFNIENEIGGDFERAVKLRRQVVEKKMGRQVSSLPYQHFNYEKVHGQCCENVIGTVQIPVGVAGPLVVDGKEYFVPLATTEGALVASTTRGCKAISVCGGAKTEILADGMSRAPVLQCPDARTGAAVKRYIEENFELFQQAFASTTRFGRLREIKSWVVGRKLFVRFKCTTGDAMGMNMVGKGVEHSLKLITEKFPDVSVLALSGNVCTDKKPAAINWTDGRGKSVVAEAIISGDVVRDVLKTSVEALCEVNYAKNLVGSAVAGSVGGLNAHASNIVTAVFLATGQDPAQNVESSNCITLMEPTNGGKDVYISVTMPSLEVGTVGGGTSLPGQSAMLEMLGVRGSHPTTPGANAKQLAKIVASTVMAGELSLVSALSSGHLISSHMKLNRKPGPPAH